MVSIDLIQYIYTPGLVGNVGGTVLQLLPKLSQYNILLPDGTLAGLTVGDIFFGLVESPAVYLPFVGVGAAGIAGIT
jgi:hypothetical protein